MAYARRITRYRRKTRIARKAKLVRRVRVNAQYRRARRILSHQRALRQRSTARLARFYVSREQAFIDTIPEANDVFAWGDLARPVTGRSVNAVQIMASKYSQFKVNLVVIKITPSVNKLVDTRIQDTTDVSIQNHPHRMAALVLPNAEARNNQKAAPTFMDIMNVPGAKSCRYGNTLKLFLRPKSYVFNGLQNTSSGSNTHQMRFGWQDTAMLLSQPPGGADYLGTYTYAFDKHSLLAESMLVEMYFYCSFKGERSSVLHIP